jgi:hypothetical protein
MGASTSTHGKYVVGIYGEKTEKSPDVVMIEEKFARLVKEVKNRVNSAENEGLGARMLSTIRPSVDSKYPKYVLGYRKAMSERYSEADENLTTGSLPDSYISDKLVLVTDYYSQKVSEINTRITTDCDIKGFCPRHVIDPNTGKQRELEPLDDIHPCQLLSCMKEQLESQLGKYKRWLITMKWAGDTAAGRDKIENIEVTRNGLLEMLHRIQQTVLMSIENVSDVNTEDKGDNEETLQKKHTSINLSKLIEMISPQSTSWSYIIAVLVVIIVVATIIIIYFGVWRKTSPKISAGKV